jgi:hypothetical protein
MAKHISTYLLPFEDVYSFLHVVNYVSEVLAERFILMEYTELFPSGRITSDLLDMYRFYYGRNGSALTDTAGGVRWFLQLNDGTYNQMRGYSQSFHVFSYCVVKYSILGRYVF